MAATTAKEQPESYRFTKEVRRLIRLLAQSLRSSKTYAVETAVRETAERRGIK